MADFFLLENSRNNAHLSLSWSEVEIRKFLQFILCLVFISIPIMIVLIKGNGAR